MAKFIVTATFSEERPVEAETREDAERQAWRHYAGQPGRLLKGLMVRAEEDTGEAAYWRLLAKAHCTIDYCAGVAMQWMSAGCQGGVHRAPALLPVRQRVLEGGDHQTGKGEFQLPIDKIGGGKRKWRK